MLKLLARCCWSCTCTRGQTTEREPTDVHVTANPLYGRLQDFDIDEQPPAARCPIKPSQLPMATFCAFSHIQQLFHLDDIKNQEGTAVQTWYHEQYQLYLLGRSYERAAIEDEGLG